MLGLFAFAVQNARAEFPVRTNLDESVIAGTGLEGSSGKPEAGCVRAAKAGPAGVLPATSEHIDSSNASPPASECRGDGPVEPYGGDHGRSSTIKERG